MSPVVLWSVTPELTDSPYIGEVVPAVEARGWRIERLSVARLLTRHRQIVHIQWPEHVSRGAGLAKTLLKHVRAVALLAALDAVEHQLVLTGHNVEPHGASDAIDRWFRRALQRRADALVVLAPGQEVELERLARLKPGARIVHAPLPVLSSGPPLIRAHDADGHLLMLGQIHPYHRTGEFIRTLIEQGNARPVVVAGRVGDDDLLNQLESLSHDHAWLTVRPGFQSDDAVDELVRGAAAVVSLQQTPFNSGAAPFALPRHIPVAMSAGDQASMFERAVGAEWVLPIPPDLSRFSLAKLEAWIEMGRTTPDLSDFTLEKVADVHDALYNSLLQ